MEVQVGYTVRAQEGGEGPRAAETLLGWAGPARRGQNLWNSLTTPRPQPTPDPNLPAESPNRLDPTHPRPPSPKRNVRTSGGRDAPQPMDTAERADKDVPASA